MPRAASVHVAEDASREGERDAPKPEPPNIREANSKSCRSTEEQPGPDLNPHACEQRSVSHTLCVRKLDELPRIEA